MSEPFLAEIRIFGFNFAPRGWAFCDGQILPINQNQSLYSLLGTTYGGDGRTSFALPDLRGRTPIHVGASNGTAHLLGQKSGEETHTLSGAEMPQHTHTLKGSTNTPTSPLATNNVWSRGAQNQYAPSAAATNVNMGSQTLLNAGGGQAHDNMMPYLTINFGIALRGLFPSRN
ncbi:MAG: tail fiber protein [Pseudomonadota bacterium]